MSLLEQLSQKETWKDFRIYKAERNQLSKRELKELDVFIEEQKYLSVTDTFSFGYPTKKTISKMGSEKKRTVYSYSDDETWVLKVLSWLLYRYDCKIPESCYSFRPHKTSKTAFDSIRKIPELDSCFVLKADIHDYFNSINVDKLLIILHQVINDDEPLYQFIEGLLTQDRCYYNYELRSEEHTSELQSR